MKDFVDEYYPVEKFRKAYSRLVEPLEDKFFWPKVDMASEVCAPIGRRPLGRQRKNKFKSCVEGGSGKKPTGNENEKTKKIGSWQIQVSKL